MDLEQIRQICLALPYAEEDIKWEKDLCFTVGEKMFWIGSLEGNFNCSIKVDAEEYDSLISREGIKPAPYLARYKWVQIADPQAMDQQEWKNRIHRSYELVWAKLPAWLRKNLETL